MTAGLGFGGETKAPARVKRKQPKPSMMNEEERQKCVCLPHDKACALRAAHAELLLHGAHHPSEVFRSCFDVSPS